MIQIKTAWDRPYRPLQGDHAAAFMIQLLADPTAENLPVDLHIILDISGSMNANRKLTEAKKACHFIINHLKEQDTLSITAFNDIIYEVVKPSKMSPVQKQQAENSINQLTARGVTRLDLAFEHVLKQPVSGPSFVILISDGRPTDAKGKRISDTAHLLNQAEKIGTDGRKMIVTALGDPRSYEADFFNLMAQRTAGPFRFSPHAKELEDVLSEDIAVIQNAAVEKVSIEFRFHKPSTRLLWFGRAYPDKQFMESHTSDAEFLIGTLSHNEPQTFIAYIMTTGDLESRSGRTEEGTFTARCKGPTGNWDTSHAIEIEYSDNPEHLNYLDSKVNNLRLELEETDRTMKAIDAKEKGNDQAFNLHLSAAKKTRRELGKSTDDLDRMKQTKKDEDPSALAELIRKARKSKKPDV